MSPISKTDRDKARDGKLGNVSCRMKNLKGVERIGGVWRRPVKIKELETKNRVVGTLREIGLVI